MNRKAQVQIYAFMIAATILVLVLALAPSVKEATDNARNQTVGDLIGMDCDNSSISDFQKAGCLASDLNMFYFIGSLIFIIGAVVTAGITLGGSNE